MSILLCKLPRAGLGNQLFPLMKAYTYGYLNNMPIVVTGYHQFKIGPYLRGDKSKRKYNNYFNFQKGIFDQQLDKWSIFRNKHLTVKEEPPLEIKNEPEEDEAIYTFSAIPHWSDYFDQLKDFRTTVIELLWGIIRNDFRQKVDAQKSPCIGVHIRMGDFRKLAQGEDFRKVGAVRTPEEYFIEMIEAIRAIHGSKLHVSVFTDGRRHEFTRLFSLENITMVEGNPDIVDMLLLSKSKIIVTAAGSTFSYWAGFLSNAALIMHPDHLHAPIRPNEFNQLWYEGPLNSRFPDNLLIENIKRIDHG